MADDLIFAGGDPKPGLPEGLDFGNDFSEDDLDASTGASTGGTTDDDTDTGADDAGGADQDAGGADAAADADDGEASSGDDSEESASDGEEGTREVDENGDEVNPAGKGKPKGPAIPKARFDQALRKQRMAEQKAQELEQRIAEMEAAAAQAAAPKPLSTEEIQAKMVEANTALIAGETEKAAALQAEVLAALAPRQAPAQQQAPAEADVVARVRESMQFEQVLSDVFESYPELDDGSDDFDEELASESVILQKSFIDKGYSISEATQKAAEYVAKVHGLENRKAPVAPAISKAKQEQQAKTAAKIEKATKAPPKVAGNRDESEPAFDINNASPDEFMALPQSVRDRLLGNVI